MERVRHLVSARTVGIALGALACVAIAICAIWFSSAGNFPVFPRIQNDYTDLGQAFLHGQLSLLEQPDPRLATVQNPYDIKQLKNIPYHWDASYYHGKYYLYWGPVPGLIAALLIRLAGVALAEPLLILVPYIGSVALFLAILMRLSMYFSSRAVRLSFALFVLLGFFNFPFLYVLGNPRSYESAILFGQFFLLAGLLAWLNYVSVGTGHKSAWLFLAGLNWGLALGCRYNLIISVIIYAGLGFIWLARQSLSNGLWKKAVLLVLPLALCSLGLAAYNQLRFDNPLETGLTYQLTIPELHHVNFSLSYAQVNTYVYLLYPLVGANSFPFIEAPNFHPRLVPDWLVIPRTRTFDQDMPGMIFTVPGLWLLTLAIPLFILGVLSAARRAAVPVDDQPDARPKYFLFAMILSAAAGQIFFLLVFFYAAERYVLDFFPPLILVIALLVWQMDEAVRSVRLLRPVLWLAVAGFTAWTVGLTYFGAFGVRSRILPFYDPAMVAQVSAFWNHLHSGLQTFLPIAR